jgi:uncharacterized protein YfeS
VQRALYGDLSAADALADLDRADATSCLTVQRLRNERRVASSATGARMRITGAVDAAALKAAVAALADGRLR